MEPLRAGAGAQQRALPRFVKSGLWRSKLCNEQQHLREKTTVRKLSQERLCQPAHVGRIPFQGLEAQAVVELFLDRHHGAQARKGPRGLFGSSGQPAVNGGATALIAVWGGERDGDGRGIGALISRDGFRG